MLSSFNDLATRFRRDQRGATAVEYGIMVSLIAVVIIVAVTLLGGNLKVTFDKTACSVSGKTYTAATPASGTTAATLASCA
ncbi:Flp family type IVb pilin [Pseudarthrobacter cellobiosi]|uniref:Flp family type IVb pilin n=1 Tax=Pseudarthrobacter cellobiosi TaxID=2953654 RepID=UPI00208E779A|nr:Flp family type IVb pilin [Pseudarthrobacter sp. HLT1-5]MCO4256764.1 Flp family type IVb pilin [Pseudarthrobacter sp. HLT1-5]